MSSSMELHQQTAAELLSGLNEGAFSSVELTDHFLKRIDALDSRYNSYISTTADLARAQATKADDARTKGSAPALCGLPIAHKDIFCIEGTRTSCGSKMLDNFIAPYTATAVEKLNAAGLVTLGKTNMDEFAMGSSNETSFYGAVSNPWNTDCVPGGSSGGSAAAVAAGLAPWATGTDTGGSIRQPAALCGLTGLKPTYGRVSRYGMIAFASSLDQAGPMARSAEDCALMLQAMSGLDLKDSTSMDQAVPNFSAELNTPLSGLRIGLPSEYLSDALDPDIAKAVQEGINVLKSLGATIKEISLPHTNLAVPCYYIIAPAEASANLSRFDGVRYGYRCKDPTDLEDLYTRSREEGFGDEVKRRILVGAYALSSGYYDAYYKQAQKIRRLIKNDFNAAFAGVDLIVGPTAPNPAFKKGEKTNDPVTMYLEDIFTIAVNLAGLPAISMPAGFAKGLPAGMQLIGPDWQEARILNAAHQYQTQTDWHRQTPTQ